MCHHVACCQAEWPLDDAALDALGGVGAATSSAPSEVMEDVQEETKDGAEVNQGDRDKRVDARAQTQWLLMCPT